MAAGESLNSIQVRNLQDQLIALKLRSRKTTFSILSNRGPTIALPSSYFRVFTSFQEHLEC